MLFSSFYHLLFLLSPSLMLFFVFIILSLSLSVFPYVMLCFFLLSSSLMLFFVLLILSLSLSVFPLCYAFFFLLSPSLPFITFSYVILCFYNSITFSFCLSLCYASFLPSILFSYVILCFTDSITFSFCLSYFTLVYFGVKAWSFSLCAPLYCIGFALVWVVFQRMVLPMIFEFWLELIDWWGIYCMTISGRLFIMLLFVILCLFLLSPSLMLFLVFINLSLSLTVFLELVKRQCEAGLCVDTKLRARAMDNRGLMISRRLQIAGVRPPLGPASKADAGVTGA